MMKARKRSQKSLAQAHRRATVRLLREYVAELKTVIAEGCQVVPRRDGSVERIGFEAMDHDIKGSFLCLCVDFTDYVNRGMEPADGDRIIENILAGKPFDRWLEGVLGDESAEE